MNPTNCYLWGYQLKTRTERLILALLPLQSTFPLYFTFNIQYPTFNIPLLAYGEGGGGLQAVVG